MILFHQSKIISNFNSKLCPEQPFLHSPFVYRRVQNLNDLFFLDPKSFELVFDFPPTVEHLLQVAFLQEMTNVDLCVLILYIFDLVTEEGRGFLVRL